MAPQTKRRRTDQVDEITFNPDARHEYLTGFHKRKLQRKENAREAAVKREKEERVRERRQLREQRKEDLEAHVAQVNAELRKQNPDLSSEEEDEGEDGLETEAPVGVTPAAPGFSQEEEEFVDEDKYTTVTVEPMGEAGVEAENDSDHDEVEVVVKTDDGNGEGKPAKRKTWNKDVKPSAKKKRSFRYESKAERQATRQKQKSKSHKAKVRRTGK